MRAVYEGRRICVTGGAGFIGGHLVDALLSLGATITVIDDLSNSTAEHLAELAEMEPTRLRFVHGSILEPAALSAAMEGCWRAFHLAAMSSVPQSIVDPERSYAVNAAGTVRVAQAAVRAKVGRVIYSASSSAYGESQRLPKRETDLPAPISPYAASKLAGEHVMLAWARSYGISTISLRYFNIFGPRQPADSPYAAVIAIFAKKLLNGQRPVIYGDGLQTRDFTFVTNAVYANLLAGASERHLFGQVVNVGTARSINLLELAATMASACGREDAGGGGAEAKEGASGAAAAAGNGKKPTSGGLDAPGADLTPEHLPARAGDVRDSLADISAARDLLGYEPLVSLEEGMEQTCAWYRSVHAAAAE